MKSGFLSGVTCGESPSSSSSSSSSPSTSPTQDSLTANIKKQRDGKKEEDGLIKASLCFVSTRVNIRITDCSIPPHPPRLPLKCFFFEVDKVVVVGRVVFGGVDVRVAAAAVFLERALVGGGWRTRRDDGAKSGEKH